MISNEIILPEVSDLGVKKRLGKGFVKTSVKALHFANYKKAAPAPKKYDYYKGKKPIPVQDWGNNDHGDCTIASQGELAQYMERQEQRKTIGISADNIIQTYYNMTSRLYGGGDTGAYEEDALNNWRNPDYTFRDSKGRPMTIDAYVKVNHTNIEEVKQALITSKAKGIKVCFALPIAWASSNDNVWDIPEGQLPVGAYLPYSWGGHSMDALAKYDENWLWLPSTWNMPAGKISWRAFAIYADEAHVVIDSVNQWKKMKADLNLKKLVSDVNQISDVKIKA
jgi:hypothetical protein